MATPRLPFLWPMLFKPTKGPRSASRIVPRSAHQSRGFTNSATHNQSRIQQRYGTANRPAPHLREEGVQNQKDDEEQVKFEKVSKEPVEEEEEEQPRTTPPPSQSQTTKTTDAPPSPPPNPPHVPESKPLDTILHMPSPAEEEERKPPHLKTPPYVHHFDTYSLVRQLVKGGLTNDQSVTVMKAVRGILTDNMELAREGLVSKSNVENETYLFRAACSELRTEIGNNRKGETEKMRSERNQLQHEVDILNQRLGQETSHLKDELKGLFDDRKMAVRQEQRMMESKARAVIFLTEHYANALADSRAELQDYRCAQLGCS